MASLLFRALCGPLEAPEPPVQWFDELRAGLPRMDGKTVAVTGCTSGTGLVLARTAAELGARVLLLNRASSRAEAALATVGEEQGVHVDCDLTSFASVRAAAARVRELCAGAGQQLDVLVLNAGVMGLVDMQTDDGIDIQMQVNHHSQFLLAAELWPLLEAAGDDARLVTHTSGARNSIYKPLSAESLGRNPSPYSGDSWPGITKWQRYQQSKLANLVFHYALHEYARKRQCGVKVVAAHPGPTNTGLQGKAGAGTWLDNFINGRAVVNGHCTEDGAMGIVRAACAPAADIESGQFYGPAVPGEGGPAVLLPDENNSDKYTPEIKELLWTASVETTGAQWP